uniref:ANK_REP_REGION domain-containing protein n=1 Tax=Macrostomum lignano TaxID=282301 RepID=A0A1I8JNA3_9PLAT
LPRGPDLLRRRHFAAAAGLLGPQQALPGAQRCTAATRDKASFKAAWQKGLLEDGSWLRCLDRHDAALRSGRKTGQAARDFCDAYGPDSVRAIGVCSWGRLGRPGVSSILRASLGCNPAHYKSGFVQRWRQRRPAPTRWTRTTTTCCWLDCAHRDRGCDCCRSDTSWLFRSRFAGAAEGLCRTLATGARDSEPKTASRASVQDSTTAEDPAMTSVPLCSVLVGGSCSTCLTSLNSSNAGHRLPPADHRWHTGGLSDLLAQLLAELDTPGTSQPHVLESPEPTFLCAFRLQEAWQLPDCSWANCVSAMRLLVRRPCSVCWRPGAGAPGAGALVLAPLDAGAPGAGAPGAGGPVLVAGAPGAGPLVLAPWCWRPCCWCWRPGAGALCWRPWCWRPGAGAPGAGAPAAGAGAPVLAPLVAGALVPWCWRPWCWPPVCSASCLVDCRQRMEVFTLDVDSASDLDGRILGCLLNSAGGPAARQLLAAASMAKDYAWQWLWIGATLPSEKVFGQDRCWCDGQRWTASCSQLCERTKWAIVKLFVQQGFRLRQICPPTSLFHAFSRPASTQQRGFSGIQFEICLFGVCSLSEKSSPSTFWTLEKESYACCFVAALLLRRIPGLSGTDDLTERQELEEMAKLTAFESRAYGILDICAAMTNLWLGRILSENWPQYGDTSILSLAADAATPSGSLSHSCCQELLTVLWRGELSVRRNGTRQVHLSHQLQAGGASVRLPTICTDVLAFYSSPVG